MALHSVANADLGQKIQVFSVTSPVLAASDDVNVLLIPAMPYAYRVIKVTIQHPLVVASADADVILEKDDGTTETAMNAAHAIDSNAADTLETIALDNNADPIVPTTHRLQARIVENGAAAAVAAIVFHVQVVALPD